MEAWAEVVAHFLAPGGTFYIAEIHPAGGMFDSVWGDTAELGYPYFHEPEPLVFDVDGSYAAPERHLEHTRQYEWPHGLGEIVTALVDAGLHVEFLHEHPWCQFEIFPDFGMTADEEGRWWPDADLDLPLTSSLKARLPA